MYDSHCHPQFPQYDIDHEEMVKRALDGGVKMICVGTDLEMSQKAVELAERYDGIWASAGLHPTEVSFKFSILNFKELIDHPKVIAIGEVGLDYYRTSEKDKQEKQKEVLIEFLNLAIEKQKPIIIHSRDAGRGSLGKVHSDMLDILNTYYVIHATNRGGVAHSFTGTAEEANKYINMGFYIGLNGIITFTDQYNETVINTPLDKILLETDAPFLAPVPNRGKRNEPLWVKHVAEHIAKLRNISVEEVIDQTTKNTEKLFKLNA
ncbi:MAG: TatD family hydrolase [bacterium]|nr:TatD family hydrolase [bacterium]